MLIITQKDRYPVKRGPYADITDADVTHFEQLLGGSNRVITGVSETEGYNVDFVNVVRGDILCDLINHNVNLQYYGLQVKVE